MVIVLETNNGKEITLFKLFSHSKKKYTEGKHHRKGTVFHRDLGVISQMVSFCSAKLFHFIARKQIMRITDIFVILAISSRERTMVLDYYIFGRADTGRNNRLTH